MSENKKAVMLIGGVCSVILCSTGFANKAEALKAEKAAEVNTVRIIENYNEPQNINKAYNENILTIHARLKEEYDLAKEEREKREAVSREAGSLMASIIFCEAGNQPYEGQVAVGAVIMNRVKSGVYPGSIEEVIYQPGQFTPACTGWLDQVRSAGSYTDSAMQAAMDALAGANPVGECLYFDRGGSGMQIGDHFFH